MMFSNDNLFTDNNLSLADKLKKEDLDGALDYLVMFEKKFEGIRTSFDCIVYANNEGWIAVIDINEDVSNWESMQPTKYTNPNSLQGNLENALYLREYSKFQDIQSINEYLSVSINVIDESNILEIVGMCSSHGTHVAAIATGNHGNDMDGIAPGAKIVSCTIGDNRLGSMETGTALVRAMIKVMELCRAGRRIHIINMSYGEHVNWSNAGRVGELMTEVINKYGVVWYD